MYKQAAKLFSNYSKRIIRFINCFLGFHSWQHYSSDKYEIIRDRDNKKDGEVILHLFICERCKKQKILPADRTYCS